MLAEPTQEERTVALLAHGSILLNIITGLGGVIAAFIIWLLYKDRSSWIAFQTLQALVYQVVTLATVAIAWLVSFVLMFLCVGLLLVPIALVFSIAVIVYGIIAALETYKGRDFRYWLIGDFLAEAGGGRGP